MKYESGPIIENIYSLINEIQDERWVMLRGRPKSPGFIETMTLSGIMNQLMSKNFRYAIKKKTLTGTLSGFI